MKEFEGISFSSKEVADKFFSEFISMTKIKKLIEEFGNQWEVAEESGEVSGEFEYKQFKETSLFRELKRRLGILYEK